MTDDHMALLRELAGDLPPLPDEVWNRALDAAFDPDADADSDLVPEMDDRPLVPDDEDIALENIAPDDEAPPPADDDSDLLLSDDLGIDADDAGSSDDLGHHLDIDLGHPDEPGDDLL